MSDSAKKPGAGSAPAIVGVIGALLTLAGAGWVGMKGGILSEQGSASSPLITSVDQRDINEAANTLTQSVAGGLVDDAKRCRIPLAWLTIARGTAQAGSTFRIRSGSYVSPYFLIGDATQRLAVPYPAPYGSGNGTLVVEGNATGAVLGLSPAMVLANLPDPQSIQVVWHAVTPC
jgi:hypothetical protein